MFVDPDIATIGAKSGMRYTPVCKKNAYNVMGVSVPINQKLLQFGPWPRRARAEKTQREGHD
jgi:hypothetical protein